MVTFSEINDYGHTFRFEPPIETGDLEVDSLERLMAIAAMGHDASDAVLEMAEFHVELGISSVGNDKNKLAVLLGYMISSDIKVTVD